MEYLEEIKRKLLANNVQLVGCTKEQILKIEKVINHKLPKNYAEFLETMGIKTDLNYDEYEKYNYNYVGFAGESIFYEDVYDDYTNKDGLIEQLEEDNKHHLLPEVNNNNVFVFFSSQGYIFAFFKLNEGENPPVYGYQEGQERDFFPKLTDSLTDFFERYLEYGNSPFKSLNEKR